MRKLLLFLIALSSIAFACLPASSTDSCSRAFGRQGGTGCNSVITSGGFTPSCTQSSNFLARATGITLTADKTNYDTLICGMVTDGTFAKMDALYIFAAPDSTTAKLNLVSSSFTGTTTLSFSASHGFTGDGATVFDTGFIASTGGSQFGLNGGSIGAYILTSNTTENAAVIGSDNISNSRNTIFLQPTFSGAQGFINASATGPNPAISNSQGFWICSRTSSTSLGLSKNGAAPTTATVSASTLDNVSVTVFGYHIGSGATYGGQTTDQISSAFIGGALSNTDISNLSSRINTFMTAYSINVY